MTKKRASRIIVTIVGLMIGLIFIMPVFIMIITSFKPSTQIFDMRLWPSTFTVESYVRVVTKYSFLHSVRNSLFVSVMTTALSLLMQTTSAYAFARLRFRGKRGMFLAVLSSMMVPFPVILIPLFLTVRTIGLSNSHWGIIIPLAANGYGVFLMRQFFMTLPKDLDESAHIDGASYFLIYWRVLLPLCKPILMTLGTAYFIFHWNNYIWPIIILNDSSLHVIQMTIAYFTTMHRTEWDMIFASTVISSVPIFLLFSYFQRYIVEGIKTTGLKG